MWGEKILKKISILPFLNHIVRCDTREGAGDLTGGEGLERTLGDGVGADGREILLLAVVNFGARVGRTTGRRGPASPKEEVL